MANVLSLRIEIYGPALCLAYSGVAERLKAAFPQASFEDEWAEIGEYQRLDTFLKHRDMSEEQRETMRRQLRSKQLSHGPTLQFTVLDPDDAEITRGSIFRWGITFRRESDFTEKATAQVIEFLNSFGVGEISCYSDLVKNQPQ